MQATGMAELRQAHRGWEMSGGPPGTSPGPATGQTGARMSATVLPAETQVGCLLALIFPPISSCGTNLTEESAVLSFEAGYSLGIVGTGKKGISAVLWVFIRSVLIWNADTTA